MMNRVCLIGRVTAKPELRYTASNIAFVRMGIAVNRTFSNSQGQREADFINIVVWRKQAENVCNFLDKGSLVGVEGKIQTTKYTDRDGNNKVMFEVVADHVQFLESKKKEEKKEEIDLHNERKDGIEVDPFADFADEVVIPDDFLD